MTFMKFMLVLVFFVLGGYYLIHMDEVNNGAGNGINTATNYFIDKSDQIITVVDYWANGPKQNYATSGSENINFMATTESIPVENYSNEIIVDIIVADDGDGVSVFQECEERFKTCVDSAHEQYGVYIEVKDVRVFNDNNDNLAEDFYNSMKIEYQKEYNTMEVIYPVILVSSEAVGLGQFVAICKDGQYPSELNQGLPC